VSKQLMEFRCTECSKIFDIMMNLSLNGNYRIHCPNCLHIHYRKVVKGKITDQRFPENHGILIEDIWPMKSACRDYSKETVLDSIETAAGYTHRLWREKFSHLVK